MFALIFFDKGWVSVPINSEDDVIYHPNNSVHIYGIDAPFRINMDKVRLIVLADSEEKANVYLETFL